MQSYMTSKKTLELNPSHPIISTLRSKFLSSPSDKTLKDLIWLLFETSLLTSGFSLDEPTYFANRIHRMIKLGLSIEEQEGKEEQEEMPLLVKEKDVYSKMEDVDWLILYVQFIDRF